jgi:hypothetical protein
MEKNLLLEIQKIRNFMGLSNFNDYYIDEIIKKDINQQLINEQAWLDDLLKLGKSAFENEELMKGILKQLDNDVKSGNKIKLPEFDSSGKKLTREEQLDEFAKQLKRDADAIETAYKANNPLSQSSYKKFTEFIDESAIAAGRDANDALLNALLQQGLKSKVFEKEGSEWLKMYNDVVELVKDEINANIELQQSFNEDEILKYFNEKLNKEIEKLPQVENRTRKVSDFEDYYDWAWKKFTNKGGSFDVILNSQDFKGAKSLMTPSNSRSAMRAKSNPKKTVLSPQDAKLFTMSRNFTFVEELLHSVVNNIKKLFKGVDEIALRVEQRQYILETYNFEDALASGGIPDELQGLLRGHYNDLQMLGTIEKNFLKQWDEFVAGMKQSGWPVEKLEKALEGTELYGSWYNILWKSESLLEALKDYEIVYRNAIKKEYGPIRSKLNEFKNTMTVQYQEAKSQFDTIKEATKVEKTVGKKIIEALKIILTPRKILSLLSYWSFFTPKQIGKMLRLAGGGSGNFKTILYSFIMVDIGMVIWKKAFKSVYAFIYYFVKFLTGQKTGNEESGTYLDQSLNEIKNIWTGLFTGTFSELTNEDGWDWIKGFDISGSILYERIIAPYTSAKPEVADTNIQLAYNERISNLWGALDNKEQKEIIETLSSNTGKPYGYFAFEVKNEPNKIIEQNPGVTKEDLDKILLSRVGLVDAEKIQIDLDVFNTLKKITQQRMSGKEMLEPEIKLLDKIKSSIKVGVFKTKDNNYYFISTDTTGVDDLEFKFQKIPFTKKYRIFDKKIGKNSYVIYYDYDINKKPEKQDRDDLESKGVDMSIYQLNSNGEFTKREDAEKVVETLNSKIPKSEPNNTKLTLKQFANLL